MSSIAMRLISSLEKVFIEDSIDSKEEWTHASMLQNEVYSFQVALTQTDIAVRSKTPAYFQIHSSLSEYISVYQVGLVPSQMPVYRNGYDAHYIKTTPGLYPDPLYAIKEGEEFFIPSGGLCSLWIMVDGHTILPAGRHTIDVIIVTEDKTEVARQCFTIEVVDAALPPQTMLVTQWLHCDCLSTYYQTEVFSERHFEIIENYIKTAAAYGINVMLTPVLTPPLDTQVGGERPTVQLVDVYQSKEAYSFGFDKLSRWIKICQKHGIMYFEISHLFTQWGAKHAPKVMAHVGGSYQRIFGWETDALSIEYKTFLQAFLKALTAFIENLGLKDRFLFHISDEPSKEHLDYYMNAKAIVSDILKDYKIIDALSDYSFYQTGAVKHPIPANNHIEPFIEGGVKDLWMYYCCSQCIDVSNKFFAMPSYRNRIIGVQCYKFDIKGFLHWGYNFWYTQFSKKAVNPFLVTDGDFFAPSGDLFCVYPKADGTPIVSLRLVVFREALQDMRAFALAESLFGRAAVMALIEQEMPITFATYPQHLSYLLMLREKINQLIKDAIC